MKYTAVVGLLVLEAKPPFSGSVNNLRRAINKAWASDKAKEIDDQDERTTKESKRKNAEGRILFKDLLGPPTLELQRVRTCISEK